MKREQAVEGRLRNRFFVSEHHTTNSVKVGLFLLPSFLTYFPPFHPLGLSPSLLSYQDVWEAEVIVMTQCRTLRHGSKPAAHPAFSLGIVAA